MQNVAGFGSPEASYRAPASGWGSHARIVYEPGGPAAGDGLNFLLSQGTGGYHLRRLRLDSTLTFDPPDSTSWGCFQSAPDGLAVHPAGCVVGISYDLGVLSVLWLPDAASSEADAPRGRVASGPGGRPGLLSGPVALCVGRLGELLVLEAQAGRVQALDLYANPIDRFGGTPYLVLVDAPGSAHLLDMASGPRGELHVLSFTGDGSDPADYHLDVYTADGAHVGRTDALAAARIAVTLTGDVLALDYEQMIGAGGRTEPVVSLWTRA